jgi:hypothetical protein
MRRPRAMNIVAIMDTLREEGYALMQRDAIEGDFL